jgi:hypothetical protein
MCRVAIAHPNSENNRTHAFPKLCIVERGLPSGGPALVLSGAALASVRAVYRQPDTRGLKVLRISRPFIPLLLLLAPVAAQAAFSPRQIVAFQAGDRGWHLGTLAVGNIDADPQLEMVVPYRNSAGQWHLDAFDWSGARLPGFPYASGEEMNVSPTLTDLDSDGRDEIVFTRGNNVIALRGNGTVLWSTEIHSANYVPNGGYQVVTNGFWWSDGPVFLNRLRSTAVFSSQVSPPIVADVNGDGRKEVLTAWKIKPDPSNGAQDFNPFINDIFGSAEWGTASESWSGGVVFLNAQTGAKDFVYHIHQLVESGLAVGQADEDGPLETYVLNDSDSVVCFDRTRPHGLWGKGMLHKQFGKNQRLMTGSYQVPQDIYTADIDGDGRAEVLASGTRLSALWTPNETILDDDGAILWRQWRSTLAVSNVHGWFNSGCLIPINPDGDNHIDVLGFNHSHELTFRYWNGAELVHRPGWPKNFAPHLPAPPVVGDVDGDGEEEIIVATHDPASNPSDGGISVFRLNGELRHFQPIPGGVKHIPFLADVNGDNSIDLVFRSLLGRVYVYNFGGVGAARVSWATHRANKERNGTSTLFPVGTPLVIEKTSGFRRVTLSWTNTALAQGHHVYRAETSAGPFLHVATLTATTRAFTDCDVRDGCQYFYEVGALAPSGIVRSAPVALTALLNDNLLANAGFEQNDNSHWDKWYTGNIAMTDMLGSTSVVYQGRQSMEIRLRNKGNNSSIAQLNQYGIPESSVPVKPGAFYSFGGFFKNGGLSEPTEHWLEWSSTKTGQDTNNRPSLPWPNYFTPHFAVGRAASAWVYANRVFSMPARFPNIELRHRYTTPEPVTGSVYLDNVFFRELPAPDSPRWTVLVPFNDEWRYRPGAPVPGWYAPAFDDSSWRLGLAKFGAGDGPDNIITPLPRYQPQYCFRRNFWCDPAELEELLLAATCTDDYAGTILPLRVWLNGVELITTGIETVTGQGNEKRYYDLSPFMHLVRPGDNTLAVMVRNTWTDGWDDVAFDVSLRAIERSVGPPRLRIESAGLGGTLLSVESPPETIWKIESCDRIDGPWQTLQGFTSTGALAQFLDTRPAAILSPNGSGARFYRLTPY